ncbi:hypothetical protein CROQUDRAFT_721652 [Cronartium quercuum f. sp. fusiforme G11]|uniref:Uncharacterized protein n=1 Tax=Cronartium quercuum f. sp. fusiforme G11 TaxID=708437 RepID=A0A9P6NQN7_9BASI|nr:hypothetical protein CROQUDRAFT_721652 [Cronartium quercuum f. sp. fusiforme G11]
MPLGSYIDHGDKRTPYLGSFEGGDSLAVFQGPSLDEVMTFSPAGSHSFTPRTLTRRG